ncbi:MAG: hypothetical protein DI538_22985 [Azospira oryzae]|nr:MAG: hypothetical protein DI538_22985 [Azospira oryzae]
MSATWTIRKQFIYSLAMIRIGELNSRQIFYTNVRTDQQWFDQLPASNWLAFTIADKEDKHLLDEAVAKCLDKNVLYTCSTGELASETEDWFDGEIVLRQVHLEEQTGKPQDYETAAMTTSFKNFDEGFWFAVKSAYATAYDEYILMDTICCIDLTQRGVKRHIAELVGKIKEEWIPRMKKPKLQNMMTSNLFA